jgi:tetratricopeptide (TPR) repeat protein
MDYFVQFQQLNDIFNKFDAGILSTKETSRLLSEELMKLLRVEDLAGEQRNLIRDLYMTLDKSLEEYLSTAKLVAAKSASESSLKKADSKLKEAVRAGRDSFIEFFKRQTSVKASRKADLNLEVMEVPAEDLDSIQEYIKKNPDDAEAYNRLGNYYLNVNKDPDKAIDQFKIAIEKNPDHYVYDAAIGEVLYTKAANSDDDAYRKTNFTEAKRWYKNALTKKPQDDVSLNNLGNVCSLLGEYTEAIDYYREAIQLNATPVYFVNLGDNYIQLNEFENAAKSYESALMIDENSKPAHIAIGNTYRQMWINTGNEDLLKKSIEHYEKATTVDPNDEEPYSLLGDIYYYNKDYDAAISNYIKATGLIKENAGTTPNDLSINRKNSYILANIGYAYFWKGDYDKASEYYNKSLDMDPGNTVVLKYIGDYNKFFGNYAEAVEYYKKYLDALPAQSDILNSLSEIYARYSESHPDIPDYSKSLDYAMKAKDVDPTRYVTYMNISYAYKGLKDIVNAESNIREALKLNNSESIIFTALGSILIDKLDFAGAIEQFKKAIELLPEAPINYEWLASTFMRLKRWDDAIKYAELGDSKARAINPKDASYVEILARIYHYKGLELWNNRNVKEAIEEYKKANNIKQSDVTYYNIYLCYFYLKQYSEAKEALSIAINLAPRVNPSYTDALKNLQYYIK